MERVLSLDDLSRMLLISNATAKNWVSLGKIEPQKIIDNKQYFTVSYCEELIESLKNGRNNNLKSRRNKNFKTGYELYKSYIPLESKNISIANDLIEYCKELNLNFSSSELEEIVSYYAKNILKQRTKNDYELYKYLADEISVSDNVFNKYPKLKNFNFVYEQGTDILGLIYISLKNLSQRKSNGAYYTPTNVVQKLILATFDNYSGGLVIDPCCGSGNFLLQLPDNIPCENIYAGDIDDLGIKISRLNFALKYQIFDKKFLYEHVKLQDFLNSNEALKYDYIIGNPPWAYNFNEADKEFLRKKYKTAQASSIESFDLMTEQAVKKLNLNGILSFVLPESILNVKSHKIMRKIIIEETSIRYLEYLGDIFDGVQCPSIILKLLKNIDYGTKNLFVKSEDKEFVIKQNRVVKADCFNFNCTDEEYLLLEKIDNIPNKVTLKNNAIFALGIVTGDNKKYLSKYKTKMNEPIVKGSDISKFLLKSPQNYILYGENKFQQCAPIEVYRTKEKLLYKFISKKLVFAYDNKQMITLNSCNILIPQIKGLNIRYILGILNSSIAQFYFEKKFNSLKVLRSHIEQIPIPNVGYKYQEPIISAVDKILNQNGNYEQLCNYIDEQCSILYGVS